VRREPLTVPAATKKKYGPKKSTIILLMIGAGVTWFIYYADEAAKKDREAYEQCLKEHPLTAEQTAAKKHFSTCFEDRHMPSSVWSDNQRKTMLIGEGCYPDDRDDPLYDVAYVKNYCDLQALKKAYDEE
jgi:hypothetical protein